MGVPKVVLLLWACLVLVQGAPAPARIEGVQQGRFYADYTGTHQFFPPASNYTNEHNLTRQRDKRLRLEEIRNQILQLLGNRNRAPVSPTSNPYCGELQTYTASCGNIVDPELRTLHGIHVFFNITDPTPAEQNISPEPVTPITVSRRSRGRAAAPVTTTTTTTPAPPSKKSLISARLRLYKLGEATVSQEILRPDPCTAEPCNTLAGQPAAFGPTDSSNVGLFEPAPLEKIFVHVSFYDTTLGGKLYYGNKKLLHTRTLAVKESGWIDFDIQKAVKSWMETGTNYGLHIQVTNEDNLVLDPKKYFFTPDCPILSNANSSNPKGSEAPILEICTISMPAGAESSSSSNGVKSFHVPAQAGQGVTPAAPVTHAHRHRHGSARKVPEPEPYMQADSPVPTTAFTLTPDHPLRWILATASPGPVRSSKFRSRSRGQADGEDNGVRSVVFENRLGGSR